MASHPQNPVRTGPVGGHPRRPAAPAHVRRQSRFGLSIVLPALILFVALLLVPFLRSLGFAFFESTLFSPEPKFVGLENFRDLFSDRVFLETWLRTLFYVGITTGVTVVLGFAWALVLNQAFTGRKVIRTATILPWILPSTVTAFLWAWIFNGQFGLLNAVLDAAGAIGAPVVWLSTPTGAMFAVILAKVWLSTPVAMSFLLAGLQSVSSEEIDAAMMDGCRAGNIIRHVILPHIFPTLVIVFVLQAMANFQQIDTILAMTRGGPARTTTVLSIEVYQKAFNEWDMGHASAIGVVWFLTLAVPTVVYLRAIFKRF